MSDTAIETIELTKSYRRRCVVDRLNLRVLPGDIYGFLGPNGAGKSTTIRMLTGLVSPNHGAVKLLGLDARSRRTEVMRQVGALVESPSLYKFLTGRENLRLLAGLSGGSSPERIDEVLDIVGLLDRADDKVKAYSHGMCQRLGIAQALLPDPKLIILDEPTDGLDPQGMKDVRQLILSLARDRHVTVFLSSHLLHEVEQVCTRVGIISRGRLIAEGGVEELLGGSDGAEFVVSDPGRALQVLESFRAEPAGADRIAVHAERERIPEANRALASAGVDVYEIRPRISGLEDFFLDLTTEEESVH